MTYVGKPTAEQRARWHNPPIPPPPPPPYRDPPSHYTDPPPPTQLFYIPPLRSLYNPAGDATPYFSLGMALCGLVCIVAATVAISKNTQLHQDKKVLEIQLEDYQKTSDDHAKASEKLDAERLKQAVENEFNFFKDLPHFPVESPAPTPTQPPYTPWPLELEEEGAESIQKIPS